MPEPLSLIAIGAAVGGVAGKFAGRAWDSAERWLVERFGSHAADAQAQARRNAAEFVRDLSSKLAILEADRRIEQQRIEAAERHPQFSALLQRSLLNAAETDDHSKHELLASLVAARLMVDAETTLSLASGLAADAIARSTTRQLKLMALCSFIDEVRPRVIATVSEYRSWIEWSLAPFDNFEFKEIDARHLVAIACASYDRRSERDLLVWLNFKAPRPFKLDALAEGLSESIELQVLKSHWDEGLAGVMLTSVGSIVGALAFDQVVGVTAGLPEWD